MSSEGEVVVRSLSTEEWRHHRQVRLAALSTDPDAFGATLVSAVQLSEGAWRRRTNGLAWFAFLGDQPVGMVRLWFDPISKPEPEVIALWVAPEVRGQGIARELMQAAIDASRALGDSVKLWVVGTNAAARRLYETLGFRPTGLTTATADGREELQLALTF